MPNISSALYISVAFISFASHVLKSIEIVAFTTSITYFSLTIIQFKLPVWINCKYAYLGQTATLYSALASIIVYYNGHRVQKLLLFWGLVAFLIIVFVFVLIVNKKYINYLNKKISDPDYPNLVSGGKNASCELMKVYLHDQMDIINNVYSFELLRRFPTNYYLNLYFVYWSLIISDVPISLDSIIMNLYPHKDFSDVKFLMYKTMLRYIGPINPPAIETYNKYMLRNHKRIFKLLKCLQIIYETTYDELTMNLHLNILEFANEYEIATHDLLDFVQTYPNSPCGNFFIKMYEVMFPFASEIKDLKFWQNYKFDHLQAAMSFHPSLGHAFSKNPKFFKSRVPDYSQTTTIGETEELTKFLQEKAKNTNEISFENILGPFCYNLTRFRCYSNYLFVFLVFVLFATTVIKNDFYEVRRSQNLFGISTFLCDATTISMIMNNLNYSMLNENAKKTLLFYVNLIDSELHWFASFSNLQSLIHQKRINFDINGTNEISISYSAALQYALIYCRSFAEKEEGKDVPWDIYTDFREKLKAFTEQILDDIFHNSFDEDLTKDANVTFFITLLFISNVFLMIVIQKLFSDGQKKFGYFIQTLNETSKQALSDMKNEINKIISFMNFTDQRIHIHKNRQTPLKSFELPFYFLVILFLALLVSGTFVHHCFIMKLKWKAYVDKLTTESAFSVSSTIVAYFDIVISNKTIEEKRLADAIIKKSHFSLVNITWLTSSMESFCHLCSAQDFYNYHEKDSLLPSSFFSWLVDIVKISMNYIDRPKNNENIINNRNNNNAYSNDDMNINNSVDLNEVNISFFYEPISNYFDDILPGFQHYMIQFKSFVNDDMLLSFYIEMLLLAAITLLLVVLPFFAYSLAYKADKPFRIILFLFRSLPLSAFSPSTLAILVDKKWEKKIIDKKYDETMYSKILEQMNEAAIVVDISLTVVHLNKIAREFFEEDQLIIGQKLFEVLAIDFADQSGNSLRTIIEQYLFGDCCSVYSTNIIGKKMIMDKIYFRFSILPLLADGNRSTLKLALLFYDITDIEVKRIQLKEEEERPAQILSSILPKEVVVPLLEHKKPFSFFVPKTVIIVIRIHCQNISLYDRIFDIFDKLVESYEIISFLMNESCLICGSGFFMQEIEPRIHVSESLSFCFDLIDRFNSLGFCKLQIGCAFGGPLMAGIMGVHKPIFDVTSDILVEARMLEITGLVGRAHVNQEICDIILGENLNFNVRDANDGSYFIERKPFAM